MLAIVMEHYLLMSLLIYHACPRSSPWWWVVEFSKTAIEDKGHLHEHFQAKVPVAKGKHIL